MNPPLVNGSPSHPQVSRSAGNYIFLGRESDHVHPHCRARAGQEIPRPTRERCVASSRRIRSGERTACRNDRRGGDHGDRDINAYQNSTCRNRICPR